MKQIKKRIRKKRIIKRLLPFLLTIIITMAMIFGVIKICSLFFPDNRFNGYVPAAFGGKISKNVKTAQSLEIPDWIDYQIINVHTTARTGAHLKDIKNTSLSKLKNDIINRVRK